MKWTEETPTQPGWFWHRDDRESEPVAIYRIDFSRGLGIAHLGSTSMGLAYFVGLWAGPIPEPDGTAGGADVKGGRPCP